MTAWSWLDEFSMEDTHVWVDEWVVVCHHLNILASKRGTHELQIENKRMKNI